MKRKFVIDGVPGSMAPGQDMDHPTKIWQTFDEVHGLNGLNLSNIMKQMSLYPWILLGGPLREWTPRSGAIFIEFTLFTE